MEENKSLWSDTVELPRRERLTGDLQAEVVIIGAGMSGVLIAHKLQQRGIRAVVLEANRVGGGQTQNTTAKLTSQHGMLYDALIKRFGSERARQYAQANELAIREYAALVNELHIACDFREAPAYLYSVVSDEPMRREAEAARRLGIDASFEPETELPFAIAGAVRFAGQAQLHPLKLLKALSERLDVYEDARALTVEGNTVKTEHGSVRADAIVFATHYPFINVPGWYFMRMHQERNYVLALESPWLPDGMYLGVDAGGLSFRAAQGLLLLGGGSHRTGENSAGGRYRELYTRAQKLMPGCKQRARWSAQDCITLDGVPYIGRYAPSAPSWYVATGFAKWGMSSSMVAAMLISGLIAGDAPDWGEVFSPARLRLSASAKSLATETAQAFKGLTRRALSVPSATLDALPKGHGGIMEVDGRKAGVYKDEDGACHVIDPRCPHLGCELEWNPDERSWDCPCHGSRFAYDGALIDNPAQEGLTRWNT